MSIFSLRGLAPALPSFVLAAGGFALLAPGQGVHAEEASRASTQIIEEITVTARKREERIIDTPVAVSVMSADEIDRYNTRDLTDLTKPGNE